MNDGEATLEGVVSGNTIKGSVRKGVQTFPFTAHRISDDDSVSYPTPLYICEVTQYRDINDDEATAPWHDAAPGKIVSADIDPATVHSAIHVGHYGQGGGPNTAWDYLVAQCQGPYPASAQLCPAEQGRLPRMNAPMVHSLGCDSR